MDEHRVKGAGRRVIGRIESTAGALAGAPKTEVRGRVREAVGGLQQNYGFAIDAARAFAVEQPITALLAAAGTGFLIGLIAARR